MPDHDDHPSPPKFLDLAEAVIDKHREADDDRDPYDAAEHDLVEFIRKHRATVIDGQQFWIGRERRLDFHGTYITPVDFSGRRVEFGFIPLDPPANGE